MTALQIRFILPGKIQTTEAEWIPHLQLEILAEIAAQLAEANEKPAPAPRWVHLTYGGKPAVVEVSSIVDVYETSNGICIHQLGENSEQDRYVDGTLEEVCALLDIPVSK